MLFLFYVVYSQCLVTPPRDFYEKIAMVNIFILRRGRNTYKSRFTRALQPAHPATVDT